MTFRPNVVTSVILAKVRLMVIFCVIGYMGEVCVCVYEGERECVCVCLRESVCLYEKEREIVCVCVTERECVFV